VAERLEDVLERRRQWHPRAVPQVGVALDARQQLAVALRYLAGLGFSENIAGHITVRADDETLWANPWGLWWEEVTPDDIVRVDLAGEVVEGRWDVTPAIVIHTELHRRRPDVAAVVHNHPYAASVLAASATLPAPWHQTGSLFLDDLVLVDEYTGEIDTAELGGALAEAIGAANAALLANHGVVCAGASLGEAVYRAVSLERMCRLDLDVRALGRPGRVVPIDVQRAMRQSLLGRGVDVFWAGVVRQTVAAHPEVGWATLVGATRRGEVGRADA
jgi:ribulose-5-phosphate 4-epimerase/fuculose-1-phosphate aldolase